jgi:hypothetical protein
MALNTDHDALVVALKTCARVSPATARIVHIKNTLELEEMEVSEPYLSELKSRNDVEVLSEPAPMAFSPEGRLISITGARKSLTHG